MVEPFTNFQLPYSLHHSLGVCWCLYCSYLYELSNIHHYSCSVHNSVNTCPMYNSRYNERSLYTIGIHSGMSQHSVEQLWLFSQISHTERRSSFLFFLPFFALDPCIKKEISCHFFLYVVWRHNIDMRRGVETVKCHYMMDYVEPPWPRLGLQYIYL